MSQVAVPALLVTGVLLAAIVCDLRRRVIPNALILAGLSLAMIWQFAGTPGSWAFDPSAPGAAGALGGLSAFLAMIVGFFPWYALRIMGAGDVKLIAVVAAFFGASPGAWGHLLGLGVSILVAGGVLALVRIAVSRNASAVLSNVRVIIGGYSAKFAGMPGPVFDPRADSVDRMPYAVAIAVGTVFYMVGKWSGWLQVL
jgi:prepilin peptidase CpaA